MPILTKLIKQTRDLSLGEHLPACLSRVQGADEACDLGHESGSESQKLRLPYIPRLAPLDFGKMVQEPEASLSIPK